MKITLTGRPNGVVVQANTVVFVLVSPAAPELPKELPAAPTATPYIVYAGRAAWSKVAPLLAADPQDYLILEGHARFDAERGELAVFAQMLTTRARQLAAVAAAEPPAA